MRLKRILSGLTPATLGLLAILVTAACGGGGEKASAPTQEEPAAADLRQHCPWAHPGRGLDLQHRRRSSRHGRESGERQLRPLLPEEADARREDRLIPGVPETVISGEQDSLPHFGCRSPAGRRIPCGQSSMGVME